MRSITVTPMKPDDIPEILQLLDSELGADPISEEIFVRKVLLDRNVRSDGALVAHHADKVVGFALGIVRRYPLEDGPPDFDRGHVTLMAVEKSHQHQGIGRKLLENTECFLQANGASSVWVSPYAPNYFIPGVDERAYPGMISFLESAGYEVAYRPLSMAMDLNEYSQHTPNTPDGIRFDICRPEHIMPVLDFVRREFPGDWQRLVRETMTGIAGGNLIPDTMHVAMADGECIGFCRHDGERFGPFGVGASRRSKGIGAVLLSRCLDSMRAKGLRRAWFMWTDDSAAHLYSRMGFEETRRFSVMRKSLDVPTYQRD